MGYYYGGKPGDSYYYLTAYGLAVKNGFKGTEQEWLESLRGPAGPVSEVPGPAGPEGPEGPSGPKGENGDGISLYKVYVDPDSGVITAGGSGPVPYLWLKSRFPGVKIGDLVERYGEDVEGNPILSEACYVSGFMGEYVECQNIFGVAGPRGVQGEKGEKGDRGIQGDAIVGPKGDTGPKGEKGDTGSAGPTGPRGIKGDKGDIGPVGAPGPKGEQGPRGYIGAQGPKGDQGAQGKSIQGAYYNRQNGHLIFSLYDPASGIEKEIDAGAADTEYFLDSLMQLKNAAQAAADSIYAIQYAPTLATLDAAIILETPTLAQL